MILTVTNKRVNFREGVRMETKKVGDVTRGRTFDSAYRFSFAIAIGLFFLSPVW